MRKDLRVDVGRDGRRKDPNGMEDMKMIINRHTNHRWEHLQIPHSWSSVLVCFKRTPSFTILFISFPNRSLSLKSNQPVLSVSFSLSFFWKTRQRLHLVVVWCNCRYDFLDCSCLWCDYHYQPNLIFSFVIYWIHLVIL